MTSRSRRSRRRLAYPVIVLAALMLLCAPFFVDLIAHRAPQAKGGVVSYAGWGPLDTPVELRGAWRLEWRRGGTIAPGTAALIDVPTNWEGQRLPDGQILPGPGEARFAIELRDLAPGRYVLHVPIIFGAHRVIVDGRVAATKGVIGDGPTTSRTEVRSDEIAIDVRDAPVRIAIDIASWHHRDSGFGEPPIFGLEAAMRRWIGLEWAKDLLFQAALILLAANGLIAFLIRRKDRASLYSALAAICAVPGTAVTSYDNVLLIALPGLSFPAMLALQYVVTSACFMFFAAFARALYPNEWGRRWHAVVLGVTGLFLAAQAGALLLGDTLLASRITVLAAPVAVLVFGSILIVVVRAALRGRDGAPVFLLGTAVFSILLINAFLFWSRLVPSEYLLGPQTLSLGTLVLLFSLFVIAAERSSTAIVSAEETSGDLRRLLEVSSAITSEIRLDALLTRIVEATARMLDADRGTLLVHDPKTDELWSLVAEGVTTRELRFPANEGLAGHAFTTGETLSVGEAYDDPRFNREIDGVTGYRTHSILTMPIVARDGRRVGVMQALNRRDGRAFDDGDAKRMAAFAAQAAIAIDNATLFSQVVTANDYNESILGSMASGVITLDRDGDIAKLNPAAVRILELPDKLEGANARALLGQSNAWVIPEIDAVIATGASKYLLDVDLQTARGGTVSINLSIVPLVSEGEKVGLLILLDDISEGKRLHAAMRRFMTPKVVDQVMAQRDDFLFGTACQASVLFADIRNFTTMAEALSPRATVDVLNAVFTELFEAVAASDGVLDKFIGDAIMAVYGAPISSGRDAQNAVESALAMLTMLDTINAARAARGEEALRIGIGIATGDVVAGTIGSPKRMDYTVIGDSVNLAARLERLTKEFGVELLICEQTAAGLPDTIKVRELDPLIVRGRSRRTHIFEVLRS